MSLTNIGAVHDLRIIFRGIDNVSNVADSIQSKVRAIGGSIAALAGTGLLVTNLADQFGLLSKKQAESLDKVLSLAVATGTLINVFARLAPAVLAAASAQNIMNATTAVADALAGPLGWAILAGAIAALAAWGLSQAIQSGGGTTGPQGQTQMTPEERQRTGPAGRGQFGLDARVSTPTLFLAGEAGEERVTITPMGKAGPSSPVIAPQIVIQGVTDPMQVAVQVKAQLEQLIAREMARRG